MMLPSPCDLAKEVDGLKLDKICVAKGVSSTHRNSTNYIITHCGSG